MKTSYAFYRLSKKVFDLFRHRIPNYLQQKSLASCGESSGLGPYTKILGHENISIGHHTVLGANTLLYAVKAPLTIGNGVMFGPNVTIVTGNHRTDITGEYMYKVGNDMKLPENDQPVIIEDDVWVGANVTILKGTTIGRGSIIHAGAVVSGTVEPYTIYFSREYRRPRFTSEEIREHEKKLTEKYGQAYPIR